MKTHTICTRYGTFAIDPERDKKMVKALESDKYPSEDLLEIACKFVSKGSVVVDIGAHIGTFAIPVAAITGKIIAFEPSPEAASFLSRNALQNNVTIQLINKALGSEKGNGTLVVHNVSNAGANTLVPGGNIPITTLDDEVEHADFIKIDVEGMELEVLRGGTRLIERVRPVVLFEVNLSQLRSHCVSIRKLGLFFRVRGYRLLLPFRLRGELVLGSVPSISVIALLMYPGSYLFHRASSVFDILALSKTKLPPLSVVSVWCTIAYVIGKNLHDKMLRIQKFLA